MSQGEAAAQESATVLRAESLTRIYRMSEVEVAALLVLIAHASTELGSATAIITHNAAIAARADRVIKLADGRLVDDHHNTTRASAEELFW